MIDFDNEVHSWIHVLLGRQYFLYFDIVFIQTTLSLFEITGLFLAVFASFFILGEEQKATTKRIQLAHQPFIRPSSGVRFRAYDDASIYIKNIGLGPALFVRVAFVESNPDNPENATLKSDQPHSQYLSANEESSELIFDPRLFYEFITGSKRGGELGQDRTNYNNRLLRKELNDLIKAKVKKNFFIYIHSSDILGNQMIFKVKYLLCLEYDQDDGGEFLLKRMEIQQIGGLTRL